MREVKNNRKRLAAATLLASSIGMLGFAGAGAPAQAQAPSLGSSGTKTHAHLHSLNNSGVIGGANVTVDGRKVHVHVNAKHLVKGMPHAMHFHFDAMSDHNCPTVRDDKNGDHRLSTTEGHSSYGMIKTSLTTRGDTSPNSGLAVNRFPTTPHGKLKYDRTIRVSKQLARKIKHGKVAVVIHGIDYNQNGKYDFRGAGKSDLDPNLPAEATDPVACGVLKKVASSPLGTN
jgi:hypothetical protein